MAMEDTDRIDNDNGNSIQNMNKDCNFKLSRSDGMILIIESTSQDPPARRLKRP